MRTIASAVGGGSPLGNWFSDAFDEDYRQYCLVEEQFDMPLLWKHVYLVR